MKLLLNRPPGYDRIVAAIDAEDWRIEHMVYHVLACLDIMTTGMRPEYRDELIEVIGRRYGLHPVSAGEAFELGVLLGERERLREERDLWRGRALSLQDELMNAGDTRKARPS